MRGCVWYRERGCVWERNWVTDRGCDFNVRFNDPENRSSDWGRFIGHL